MNQGRVSSGIVDEPRHGEKPLFSLRLHHLFKLMIAAAFFFLLGRAAPPVAMVMAAVMTPFIGLMLIDYAQNKTYLRSHRIVARWLGVLMFVALGAAFWFFDLYSLMFAGYPSKASPSGIPAPARSPKAPSPQPPVPTFQSDPPPRP